MKKAINNTLLKVYTAVFFFYPLIVFLCLRYVDVTVASLVLITVLIARLFLLKQKKMNLFGKVFEIVMWVVLLNNILNLYFKNEFILKIYPVLMSAGVAGIFVHSLLIKAPIIEKFARLYEKVELSPEKLNYIRKLTFVWAAWLCMNTLFSLYTALYSSFQVWAFYNNLVFYIICGFLFIIDISFRRFKYARN